MLKSAFHTFNNCVLKIIIGFYETVTKKKFKILHSVAIGDW